MATGFQVGEILLQGAGITIIACPYDYVTIAVVSLLALYGMYCFHLGRSSKAPFARFLMLVVGPLFGEVALSSRQVGVTGAKVLVRFADYGLGALAHLGVVIHA
jgi:hypothetical protein